MNGENGEEVARPRRSLRRWLIGFLLSLAGLLVLTGVGLWWLLERNWEGPSLAELVAEVEAKGETLDLVAMAPPPVPAAENAAPRLDAVFGELMRLDEAEAHTSEELAMAAAWDAWLDADDGAESLDTFREHRTELTALLAARAAVLREAEAALALPACRFDRRYELGVNLQLPQFVPLRTLTRLFALRAVARAIDGETDGALADCARILALGGTVAEEPIILSHMIRLVSDQTAVQALEGVLGAGSPSPDAVGRLADRLEAEAAALDLANVLRGERAALWMTLEAMPRDTEIDERLWRSSILGPWLQRAWERSYLLYMGHLIEAAGEPYPQGRASMDAIEAELGEQGGKLRNLGMLMPAIGIPGLARALERHTTEVARLRAAAVGCRLSAQSESDRPLPTSLAVFPSPGRVDPFTDADLHLVRTSEAVVVYSVGPNLRDDGGRPQDGDDDSENAPDDIAFRIPVRSPAIPPPAPPDDL